MKRKKKRKIRFIGLIIIVLFFYLFYYLINSFIDIKIKNIYISNNVYLTDQEIIEIAKLSDYPSSLKNSSKTIKKRLESNTYILSANVKKKNLFEIYIEVEENKPLFYNRSLEFTILKDQTKVKDIYSVPTLINYVPDILYETFIDSMATIDKNILEKISEIKYDPNEVDEERFLLTMNDGNYVYLTIRKFNKINNYIEIMKNFDSDKGILYLDSGSYFEKY